MSQSDYQAGWRPIFQGDSQAFGLKVVEEIAADLIDSFCIFPVDHPAWLPLGHYASVSGGKAGIALFFAYLDEALPGRGYDDVALETLESAISGAARIGHRLGLFSGFTGVAWVIEHLRERIVDPEGEDPNGEVALALREALLQPGWGGSFDLVSGLTGLGVFALERLPHPLGADCLQLAVDRLTETVDLCAEGATWKTPPEFLTARLQALHPQGELNLGVAHGVPGVITLLGAACAEGYDALPLLSKAVDWVLAQKLPEGSISMYPYRIDPSGEGVIPDPARLAWCYGDIGIAVALFAAARAVGNPAWENEALAIGRFAASRPPETAEVRDAGLCHGAAGVAHLFNRLFQATGEPLFERAAFGWFSRMLSFRHPGRGVGGFLALLPVDGKESWQVDPGLLTGAVGVGLALLAACARVPPAWDRLLLASIRSSSNAQ